MKRLTRYLIIVLLLMLVGPASPAASQTDTRFVVFEGFYRHT